eukprot:9466159-Pyramimonas_sp.AAC.1
MRRICLPRLPPRLDYPAAVYTLSLRTLLPRPNACPHPLSPFAALPAAPRTRRPPLPTASSPRRHQGQVSGS